MVRSVVGTFRGENRERELLEELQGHLQLHMEDNVRSGMSAEEARRQALLALGGVEQVRERLHERRTLPSLEHVLQDIRYAVRVLRNRPGFTAAAVLSLTLGLGANAAVFGLLHALFLETLPVARPGELLRLIEPRSDGSGDLDAFRYPMYDALRRESRLLSGVAAMSYEFGRPQEIREGGRTHTALVQLVSDNYFDLLGVRAAQGRVFRDVAGEPRVESLAVISDAYWRRQYGAQPAALGARFRWGALEFTVAGIAPQGFNGTDLDVPVDIWLPLEQAIGPTNPSRTRGRWVRIIGRLQPGSTSSAASAEASAILQQPVHFASGAARYSDLRRRLATPLFLVQAVTGLVLLIACVNLANLALAGSASRERELALRQAIGASRGRVVRQLFIEAMVLATAGGGLGLLTAYWINGALLAFLPPQQAPALPNLEFQLNGAVLGFAAALVAIVAVLFGLLPAIRVTRTTGSVLKATQGTTRKEGTWFNRALLSLQVTMCTVLLVVGGIFLQTVRNLRGQEAGYRERGCFLRRCIRRSSCRNTGGMR